MAAAANKVEVRKPKVTIKGEATDSILYQATIPVSSSVDGCPSIRYSSHKAGGDRIESPTAKELIEKVAAAQTLMFQEPTKNEMVIIDGGGNGTVFMGYDTGPHHDIMFGGVNNGKSLVHRCARLLFINTSVYIPPRAEPGQDLPPTAASPQDLGKTKNPCEAIKVVLEKIIKDFLATSGGQAASTENEIRKKIHADNEKILKEEWYPILEASTESGIPAWESAVSTETIRLKIFEEIRDVYLGGTSDFSAIISTFENLFQMKFIPGHMGISPGKFIPASAMLSDEEEKEVNIVSLSMNPGPRKFLAPTAVAIRGLPPSTPPPTAAAVPNAGTAMIVWPDPLPSAGQTLVMQMPSWLPSDIFPEYPAVLGNNLDFNANFDAIKGVEAAKLVSVNLVTKICSDIARLTYNDISLRDAFASITCPLDVSWEIGKRYSIKQPSASSGGSSVLFSGFLRAVQHRVSSNPSKAEASTQLTFSHVEANGFTLPNK
jgi:hypothetical protein